MDKNALIIFQRNPELGKVKTRIAATTGPKKALEIYKQLLSHTHDVAAAVKADVFIYYSDYSEEASGSSWRYAVQEGSDLGDRMSNAFRDVFNLGYNKVCIIGTDCASLSAAIVQRAFQGLLTHRFVIGRALDGGYYLLGMHRYQPEVFRKVPWSSDLTAFYTVLQMKPLGSVYFLQELSDIDTEEDWLNFKAGTR